MRVVLISTYDLGRQPFGLAAPAAALRAAGDVVRCCDLSRGPLPDADLAAADLVAFFLPMHTAARLTLGLLPRLRRRWPDKRWAAYGLYAQLLEPQLREAGLEILDDSWIQADTIIPDRSDLPPLDRYARLQLPDGSRRIVGYTEATRGCKHRCRHCPIVPVYNGKFRVTGEAAILADIRQQVAAGAQHITFGDPDFLNGPAYAMRIVEALHREFPHLSYDVTIKVEHLLRHRELLPRLAATGCALVTTAVESFDDAILERLGKGHTAADFALALELARAACLPLNPTFVAFTPWTSVASFRAMLAQIAELDLIASIAPVQYGIRLLLPPRSLLLDQPDAAQWLGAYDPAALSYRWQALDPAADALCAAVQTAVAAGAKAGRSRLELFAEIAALAGAGGFNPPAPAPPRATVPYLDEPWFC